MDFDPQINYYGILWVDENADKKEIKKAFRKLAMKYHPDREGWDAEKFKEINQAHEVLSDDQKRQMYDSYRKWGWGFDFSWMWWSGGFGWFQWWGFDVSDLFGDMFGDLFWWTSRRRNSDGPRPWNDVVLNLKVDFKDVYSWSKKKIKYSRNVICNECKGSWQSADSHPETCPTCGGSWVVTQTQRTPFGVVQSQTACPTCQWTWKTWYKQCNHCNWQWLQTKEEIVEINIPQWINSWSKIKMPWMWHYGYKWWTPWDLYIHIIIDETWMRRKSWRNILIKKEIKLLDAVLWWTTEIQLPDKNIKIKIPKWLQIGNDIILSWYWFKKWDSLLSWKWDLIVETDIKIPKSLSKEEKELYEKIRDLK